MKKFVSQICILILFFRIIISHINNVNDMNMDMDVYCNSTNGIYCIGPNEEFIIIDDVVNSQMLKPGDKIYLKNESFYITQINIWKSNGVSSGLKDQLIEILPYPEMEIVIYNECQSNDRTVFYLDVDFWKISGRGGKIVVKTCDCSGLYQTSYVVRSANNKGVIIENLIIEDYCGSFHSGLIRFEGDNCYGNVIDNVLFYSFTHEIYVHDRICIQLRDLLSSEQNTIIKNSRFFGFEREAIDIHESDNITIESNYFQSSNHSHNFINFNTPFGNVQNIVVQNNIFHRNAQTLQVFSNFKYAHPSRFFLNHLIQNNLFFCPEEYYTSGGLFMFDSSGSGIYATIQNNIFQESCGSYLFKKEDITVYSLITFRSNVYQGSNITEFFGGDFTSLSISSNILNSKINYFQLGDYPLPFFRSSDLIEGKVYSNSPVFDFEGNVRGEYLMQIGPFQGCEGNLVPPDCLICRNKWSNVNSSCDICSFPWDKVSDCSDCMEGYDHDKSEDTCIPVCFNEISHLSCSKNHGLCIAPDVCQCSEHYFGYKCEEYINKARFVRINQIIIDHEMDYLLFEKYSLQYMTREFNCSEIISNVNVSSVCSFDVILDSLVKTSQLKILLLDDTVFVNPPFSELIMKPLTGTNYHVFMVGNEIPNNASNQVFTVVMIALGIVIIVMIVIFALLLFIFLWQNIQQRRKISKFDKLDVEILLEEQSLKNFTLDGTNVKINMHLYTVDYIELQFEKFIGSGVSSTVFLAKFHGKKIALKVFRVDTSILDGNIEFIEKEIELMKKLKHPGLVGFYGAALCKNPLKIGILVEYCSKGSLKAFIKNYKSFNNNNSYPIFSKIRMIREIAYVLDFLHSNLVIHRDLKPDNLLVSDSEEIKLIDLGLSREVAKGASTSYTKNLGTDMFIAPEMILCNLKYNEKCDVYSFAMTVFVIYTYRKFLSFSRKSSFD